MDEVLQPKIITAIADADFEGMVSSALFESGWNVIARPLDFASLTKSLKEETTENALVIYSVDLPGLSDEQLKKLASINIKFIGFADSAGSDRNFAEISSRPTNPEELLAYIRGNIRSPLMRAPLIATLLDLRKIAEEVKWRDLADDLSVAEITQDNIADFSVRVVEAAAYFDYIVIDLGSLQNIVSDLSDRRWPSQVKIWAGRFAQELFISSSTDLLQKARLNRLCTELAEVKLPARISIFITPAEPLVKKESVQPEDFRSLNPRQVQILPMDSRLCAAARKERTTLSEINGKAPLRKAIAAMALQITG